jgi:uncharacterized lipoprotein YddW (UPF0748 family)
MIKTNHLIPIFLLLFFFSKGNAQEKASYPKNEFRAVWIATVVNIDWPKYSLDSVAKQKTDFIGILDTYKKLNYNAVIVQIRSVGDAFYPSELAPWSRFLTGREGMAPQPYFDTLEWMIAESHARGFDFHAWLNPYRATFDLNKSNLSPTHDLFKHPEWMIKYGGKYYYNPALPEVQEHLTKVVEEVVQKYDIDAIHFDDYFYPYTISGEKFNDTESFQKYSNGLSIADWRRTNVTNFVKTISKTIKINKPWVQFGISPFGVWRNKSVDPRGSETQAGQTNYDDLYADPLAWMEDKDIDYIVPQLYWSINHPKASYSKLLKWWSENSKNVAIYIGNSPYKIRTDGDRNWNNPMEIPNQIDLTRTFANVQGNGVFSAKSLIGRNQDVVQILKENQYKYPAIPLAVPNLNKIVTDVPKISLVTKDIANTSFFVNFPLKSKIRYIVIYGAKTISEINVNDPSQIIDKIAFLEKNEPICIAIPNTKLENIGACALSFIDFYGNESKATSLNLQKVINK